MFTEGTSVVVGFSGGPDSLCLFDLLLDIKEEYKLNLYPVHINHNLRGDASDEDQRFCEEFSGSHGFPCDVYAFDCAETAKERGITTEEAGREFRYDSFLSVAKRAKKEHSESPVVIAVAQNADDQAETVLMRIIRGTGVDGLAGIPYKRSAGEDVFVIRPLLDIYREEIIDYCSERNLKPRFDHTNDEPVYSRNRIRLELLPSLRDYNPSIKEALIRLAHSAAEDRTFFEAVSNVIYDHTQTKGGLHHAATSIDGHGKVVSGAEVTLDRLMLKDEHPAIRRRVISMALKAAGLNEDVGAVHYDAIDEIIKSENPSAQTDLPNGYSARRVYDTIKFGRKVIGDYSARRFTACELTLSALDDVDKIPNTYAAFDLDLLKREFGEDVLDLLEFRGRRPGDVMKTEGGTKKIQDLMVDMKIPKDEREAAGLLSIGNQVLWLVPANSGIRPRYSSKWRITNETRKIAYIVLLV